VAFRLPISHQSFLATPCRPRSGFRINRDLRRLGTSAELLTTRWPVYRYSCIGAMVVWLSIALHVNHNTGSMIDRGREQFPLISHQLRERLYWHQSNPAATGVYKMKLFCLGLPSRGLNDDNCNILRNYYNVHRPLPAHIGCCVISDLLHPVYIEPLRIISTNYGPGRGCVQQL